MLITGAVSSAVTSDFSKHRSAPRSSQSIRRRPRHQHSGCVPVMTQRSSVSPSEYQARYSPRITLFFTVTLRACQKASLVSNVQRSNTAFSMYWKEYLPLSVSPSAVMSRARSRKYSPSAAQSFMVRPAVDQPNSLERISHPLSDASRHSRSALMPCSFVPQMAMRSEYQMAARHCCVSSQSRAVSPCTCQSG